MSYIARRNKLRESKVDALLVEYQVCASTRADFHTQLIWTWASAMLPVSMLPEWAYSLKQTVFRRSFCPGFVAGRRCDIPCVVVESRRLTDGTSLFV